MEKGKVRAITPFKVIQGHRFWYQSKAHMRLENRMIVASFVSTQYQRVTEDGRTDGQTDTLVSNKEAQLSAEKVRI